MDGELLRIVDTLHRDKNIDKETLFQGIEAALLSAAKRQLGASEDVRILIDRETGRIEAFDGDQELDPGTLGRVAAQTAKQIMIQRIREAERDSIYDDLARQVGQIMTGTVQRVEGRTTIVNVGRAEGVLPHREQVPGDTYRPGERIRALVIDVKKVGQKVHILLSRTHPNLVKQLFLLEVPEIGEGVVAIEGVAREAGHRAKIAVSSSDPRVDSVGACVGVRGSRIKNIVEELDGEKIDIVRWDNDPSEFISNALKPAEVSGISLYPELRKARVTVGEDQLSLAIGKKGQNVRLAAKLTGWDIDIMADTEAAMRAEAGRAELLKIPGVGEKTVEKLVGLGVTSADDIVRAGVEKLSTIDGIGTEMAREMVKSAREIISTRIQQSRPEQPASQPEAGEEGKKDSSAEEHEPNS